MIRCSQQHFLSCHISPDAHRNGNNCSKQFCSPGTITGMLSPGPCLFIKVWDQSTTSQGGASPRAEPLLPCSTAVFTHVHQVQSAGQALRSCCNHKVSAWLRLQLPIKASLAIAGSHLELAAAQQHWELKESSAQLRRGLWPRCQQHSLHQLMFIYSQHSTAHPAQPCSLSRAGSGWAQSTRAVLRHLQGLREEQVLL